MSPLSTPSRPFCLRPGQSLALYLPLGSQLQVLAGQVQLTEAPQWLAEQVHRPVRRLGTGQGHVLGGAGWVQLASIAGAAQVLCQLPPAPLRMPTALQAVRTVWRRLAAVAAS